MTVTTMHSVKANPEAHPLFPSDRGFQYTNPVFHAKLEAAGMTRSMSRAAKRIDNGPMEVFWGIIKRARYYGKRFPGRDDFVNRITIIQSITIPNDYKEI